MDARRFVRRTRKDIAQDPFGVVAGEPEPPGGVLEAERGLNHEIAAVAILRRVERFPQVQQRPLGVATRKLGGRDAHEQLRPPFGRARERRARS